MHNNQLRDCREILLLNACVFGGVVVAFLAIATVAVFSQVAGYLS